MKLHVENVITWTEYLKQYSNSPQSVSMRRSCLNYFYGCFNYSKSIFTLTKKDIEAYFIFLKTNPNLALNTKKAKFKIFKSYVKKIYYLHDDLFKSNPLFDTNYIWGDRGHAEARDKEYILSPDDITRILNYYDEDFIKYLIFSLYAFTGCRKGELQNLRISGVVLEKRILKTSGKKGKKIYCFDERIVSDLSMYLEKRTSIKAETDHLFLTKNRKPVPLRYFNLWLKEALKELKLPDLSVQYFRWSLNNNRKKMLRTPNGVCEILLGHAPSSTNERFYTGNLTHEERVELYDTNNPYKSVRI